MADAETMKKLEARRQIILRYVDASGDASEEGNPNGSLGNIAGVVNAARNVFGMMPHPEYACERLLGNEDGAKLFGSIVASMSGASEGEQPSTPSGENR